MSAAAERPRTRALVTGASGDIGGAIAAELAARDIDVLLVGRRESELAQRAAEIGPRASTHLADIGEDGELQDLVQEVGPRLDVLVHAAGVISLGPLASSPVAALDEQYRINLRAPYLLTQLLLPALVAARGQIAIVNSSAGLAPARAGVGAYSATKHGLRALTESLRAEVNADGVRVVSVYPGRTAGAMQRRLHEAEGETYDPGRLMAASDVATALADALAMPRSAEVTDVSVRPMSPP